MPIMDMLKAHPSSSQLDTQKLSECIDACFECAQVCSSCADACLAEAMVADLRTCIRTDLDCADICTATGRILVRQTEPNWEMIRAQLEACKTACAECRAECEKHKGMHDHCKICAESCMRCEKACEALLSELPN